MLYTRKGDKGTTQLYGTVSHFSKASPFTEALGALDELNSYLGLCRATISEGTLILLPTKNKKDTLPQVLHDMQETLFSIQAQIAGAHKKVHKTKITALEKMTDSIEEVITPLHSFSLSGGTVLSSHFDVARTLARKAERRVVAVHEAKLRTVHENTLAYLNRLSSLLFALARYCNHIEHVTEEGPTYS
jgi:cob(I)alamin adenosyltransferase